jgi:DNA modification methylase
MCGGVVKPYFTDGTVTIYHGDCREILPTLEFDCVLSDPPYGMSYQSGWKESSRIANDNNTECRDYVVSNLNGRPALLFGRWSVPRPTGTRELLIWDKGDWPGMGDLSLPWGPSTEEIYVLGCGFVGKRSGQILRDPKRPSGPNALHPNEKPIGLMEMLVRSCPPGVIVDPFMGSGSTLVAARNLGRRAIGVEIDERHCETAARRMSQQTLFASEQTA